MFSMVMAMAAWAMVVMNTLFFSWKSLKSLINMKTSLKNLVLTKFKSFKMKNWPESFIK